MTKLLPVLAVGLLCSVVPVWAQDMSRSSSMSEAPPPNTSSSLETDLSRSSSMETPTPPSSSSSMETDLSRSSSMEMSSEESSEDVTSSEEGPPVDPAAVLQALFDVCTDVASGDPEAPARAADAGWQPGDFEEGGPYRTVNSGYRVFDGFGEGAYRAVTDTFPSQRFGYCSGSVPDPENKLDLAAFATIGGMSGSNQVADGVGYGAWQTADGKTMTSATLADSTLYFEINLLLGPAPAN